ncbi:unnamed protein product [Tuber aestivum]|uniref:Uncharacterized protein n=1 Tax=Tuber aestivum TaxID=59557 RepID=A0A292Q3T9_9PEZI|nr:unnamed protein product [Tuber aestivum]
MGILKLGMDFVDLRSELVGFRMQFESGTPEKDVLHRYCAINTLFYNPHTEQVEGFTGLGL